MTRIEGTEDTVTSNRPSNGSAERGAALEPGSHVAGYEVGPWLGAGGFGEVYRARHTILGRDVAIKVLHRRYLHHPDAISRFVAEARTVSRISHPGIVEAFDFGTLEDGRQFCVMELVAGVTLRDRLLDGPMTLDVALPILRAIAEAVDAAHEAGVAHRDLKPDNIFVLPDGGVKLIDFGLAKLVDGTETVTQTGSVLGTPVYMSPEQCRGRSVGLATDAYSFGVVVYQILTGDVPFSGDALELALHHLNDDPDPPSTRCRDLDGRVDRVVLALLAKDPEERPRLLAPAIAALVGESSLPRAPRRRRRRLALGVAALAITAGTAITIVATRDSRQPVVVTDSCASPAERLAGVWDAPVRSAVEARFAKLDRADAPGTWRFLARDLDGYAAQWSAQWNAACRASDRATDPLLYAQRMNCLENALLDLHGISASMAEVDLEFFTLGWTGSFMHTPLANCTNVAALRAQPPAPPPEKRAEIAKLVLEIHVARADVRAEKNAGRPERREQGLARLTSVEKQLAALGAPAAATAAMFTAHYRADSASIQAAIARARDMRDDSALTLGYLLLARSEIEQLHRSRARISDAVDRAEEAFIRAGRPLIFFQPSIASVRAQLALMDGKLDVAIDLLTADANAPMSEVGQRGNEQLIHLLGFIGRHDEAIRIARGVLDERIALWGPNHHRVADAQLRVEWALAQAGDLASAITMSDTYFATLDRVRAAPEYQLNARAHRIMYGIWLDRPDVIDAGMRAFEPLFPVTPGDVRDFWGRFSDHDNDLNVRGYALNHSRSNNDENRIDYAYERGDMNQVIEIATRVHARLSGEARMKSISAWTLPIAYGLTGRVAESEKLIGEFQRHAERNQNRMTWTALGIVYQQLGRADQARRVLEKAWTLDGDDWIGLYIVLGRARLDTGDAAGALEPLARALAMESAIGVAPLRPDHELALARAIWLTDGNKQIARYLAEHARDGYARQGPFKEPQRKRAIEWLAGHTL